jgi:maltose alpha-D-glucosyltransferase/alpha-amylase
MTTTPSWLDTAVFYEIYPQSFYDTNGDGIGDLPGIIAKLDYLQSLGISALWINPCFDSPFQDAGYDVRDYYRIAARYGTNEDARRLFDEAHKRGIRVLLDLVPGHTSIEHPWFQASARHLRNEHSDWYIWTHSGWTWEAPGLRLINGYAERDASYVTNFFYCQPALNFGFARPDPQHPWQQPVDAPGPQAVRRELRNIMKFWLDLGCDGFRVDMAASLIKNDPGWTETINLWQEIRAWLDREYPEAALVSEWSHPPSALKAGFHMDFLLHFGSAAYSSLFRKSYEGGTGTDRYAFSFFDRSGHGNIMQFLDGYLPQYNETKGKGLICLISGNHDINPRLAIGRDADDLESCYLFLLTMPGAPFIYYGDEIGMRTLDGLTPKEGGLSRTGSRTPMQWEAGPGAGFSSAKPDQFYLPIDPTSDRPDVASQFADPRSLLNRIRRILAVRREHPALNASGDFEVVYAEGGKMPFVYKRRGGGETLLVAVNPAAQPAEVTLPAGTFTGDPKTLYGTESPFTRTADGWRLCLPGISGGIYQTQ